MKTIPAQIPSRAFALLLGALGTASAQERFAVTAYTDRGGGASSGGTFAVTGTAGQSDAGLSADGSGRFAVAGGFWNTLEEAAPGAMWIVSPSAAASTAAWMVGY